MCRVCVLNVVYFDNLFACYARLGFWCLRGDAFIVQLVYSCSLAWALVSVMGGVAGADCLGKR